MNPDATTLIFRRVRRSARKSFHVSCFWELAAAELAVACCAADAVGAPGAEEPCLIEIFTGATGDVVTTGRSVLWILVGRVEVENGAADAEHDAMAAGWKRIAKALAGRSPFVASMVVVW